MTDNSLLISKQLINSINQNIMKSSIVYSPSVWRAMEKYAKQQQLKRIDRIIIVCLLLEVVVFLIISAIY